MGRNRRNQPSPASSEVAGAIQPTPETFPLWQRLYAIRLELFTCTDPAQKALLRAEQGRLSQEIRQAAWREGQP